MILFYAALSALIIFPSILSAGAKKPPAPARSDFYIGEGWAELGPDAGVAREQAKIRALGDLARNVRVTVRSAIIDVLGQTAGRPHQSLESKINTYAEIPATRLDREEFILNAPRRGQLTCRVAVNRARYDSDVRQDLITKKNRALEEAHLAHSALRDGRLADAWKVLENLQSRAATDFPNLPLEGDADDDGRDEDVLFWGRARQADLRRALKLTCSPGPFIFGNDGRYPGTPTARLAWTGPGSVRLEGFPLQARWTHRPDSVAAQSFSSKGGEAPFQPAVDLFVESSVFQIELAGEGAGPEGICQIPFHRRRQAFVTVTADREDVKTKMEEEIITQLKRFPWDVQSVEETAPSGSPIRISFHVPATIVRHPDGDIYRATLAVQASIDSIYAGKNVFRGQGPTASAFGATPAEAVRQATNNIVPQLGPWLENKVRDLP